ncbi:MAG TPA: histidine phosphatase family protein [Acidimicrobiales bacterium]|nr:histidine phosphatase family protein [Acidimicrobiales bacterium]
MTAAGPATGLGLVLARHGRTAWNAEGRFQGHSDPPLDPTGRQQALRLAAQLTPLRPALVISSDLQRARSTAEPLAEAAGAPVAIDPDLREVYLGGWEGLNREEVAARFPDEYQAWSSGQPVRRGGGETEDEAGRRAASAIAAAMGGQPGLVVVISHGLVLQSAIAFLALDGLIQNGSNALHLGNGEFVIYTEDGHPWGSPTADEVPGTL